MDLTQPGRRILSAWVCAGLMALASVAGAGSVRAETIVFHATHSGQLALDTDNEGGNPFASSLIEIMGQGSVTLAGLAPALRRLTAEKSNGAQSADVPDLTGRRDWPIVPRPPGERRIALVLAVADYSQSKSNPSLAGARHDAQRIAKALAQAGFETASALDLGLAGMRARLKAFAAQSRNADAAVIYTTGHGFEVDGKVYLLPSDYPMDETGNVLTGNVLEERAMPLSEIASSVQAGNINLLFYGGCRNDPF
jgi:hypothetical protein